MLIITNAFINSPSGSDGATVGRTFFFLGRRDMRATNPGGNKIPDPGSARTNCTLKLYIGERTQLHSRNPLLPLL